MPTVPSAPEDRLLSDDEVFGQREEAGGLLTDAEVFGTSQQDRSTRVRASARLAEGMNPQQVLEAERLGSQYGLPTDVVQRQFPEVRRAAEADRLDRLLYGAPRVAEYVAEAPENLAVVREDVEQLTVLERLMAGYDPEDLPEGLQTAGAVLQGGLDLQRAFTGSVVSGLGSAARGLGELPGVMERQSQRAVSGLIGLASEDLAARFDETVAEQRARLPWWLTTDLASEAGQTIGGGIVNAGTAIGPAEERQNLATDFAAGGGSLATYLTAGAFTGGAGVLLLGAGQGVDVQAERAREAGTFGTAGADTALGIGATVTAATERLGIGFLLRRLPPSVREGLNRRVADIVMSGVGEGAQEVTEGAVQDVVTRVLVDDSFDVLQGWQQNAAMGFALGALVRGGVHVVRGQQDAALAQSDMAQVQGIGRIVDGLQLGQQDPDRLRGLLGRLVTAGREDVYVPVSDFQTLFQSEQEIDAALDAAGMDRGDYAQALLSNGRVRIPTDGFFTSFTPEQRGKLYRVARWTPNGMTPAEAEGYDPEAALADFMATAGLQGRMADDPANRIYEDMRQQLEANGATPDVAAAQAEQFAAFVRTLSEREGVSVDTIMGQAGQERMRVTSPVDPRVQAVWDGPKGDPMIDAVIDAARAGRTFTDQQVRGTRLVSTLVRRGGLRADAFGADSVRAMDGQLRPGLLRTNGEGMTLDDALVLAREAGYIDQPLASETDQYDANGPDINTLLDLIADDLSGFLPVFASGDVNMDREAFNQSVEGLLQELDERGISAEQFAGMTNAQVREALGLNRTEADARFEQRPPVEYVAEVEGETWRLIDAPAPKGVDYSEFGEIRMVLAYDGERLVGKLIYGNDGTPPTVEVAGSMRRRNIGTAMMALAEKQGGILGDPETGIRGRGAEYRTADGQAFRRGANTSKVKLTLVGPVRLNQSAFHGSPYRFDRFSLDAMGTGEGAQAYGWGLYFAGRKEVAEWYRENLTKFRGTTQFNEWLDGFLSAIGDDSTAAVRAGKAAMMAKDKSAAGIEAELESIMGRPDPEGAAYAERAASHIASVPFKQLNGQTYQVEIPEDSDLLDWDAPLSEQPEKVRAALAGLGFAVEKNPEPYRRDESWMVMFNGDSLDAFPTKKAATDALNAITGQQLYKNLATSRGQRGASEFFLSLGIPGLRYLDGTSRADSARGSRNYVIWDDGQIEVTGTLYQSNPTFTSAMLVSVEGGKGAPKSADAAAWKGWLDGAMRRGEFKQAERDWLGVDAWLDSQQGKVTREDLAEFVRLNQVQVSEVVLGAGGFTAAMREELASLSDIRRSQRTPEQQARVDELQSLANNEDNKAAGAKFSDYRTEGGENYREVLLMLPVDDAQIRRPQLDALTDELNALIERHGPISGMPPEVQAEAQRIERGHDAIADRPIPKTYQSSHWSQPNVLAHIRMDERTSADGERVLFVQEIQSDWHQAGRKQGYRKPDLSPWEAFQKQGYSVAYSDDAGGFEVYDNNGDPVGFGDTQQDAIDSLLENELTGEGFRQPMYETGVPDAPLKATDQWAMAAFKRAVREAVDKGFSRVAWATGEQNADLFDLSKTIDYVSSRRRGDEILVRTSDVEVDRRIQSSGNGRAYTNGGGGSLMTTAEIMEVFGSDLGRRIIDGAEGDGSTISDAGLKMGGEGMRGFYDNLLPKAVAKWAKPFGAKVEAVEVAGNQQLSIEITPAMREAVAAGVPLFQRNGDTARGSIEIRPAGYPGGMRQFVINLGETRDFSTFLHESGHFYLEVLRESNARLSAADPATLTADQRQLLDDHAALLRELGAESFDKVETIHHERFAETYEAYLREGRAPSTRLQRAFQKFGAWLKMVYRSLRLLPNQRLNEQTRSILDRMLATDDEIEAARQAQGLQALFETPEAAGMDEAEFGRYQEAVRASRQAAIDAEAAEQYRYERAEAKRWRTAVMAELTVKATKAMNDSPIYRALSNMRRGKMPDGSELPAGERQIKLSSDLVNDIMGPGWAGRNLAGAVSTDGMAPDLVAPVFGFRSGAEMIAALANAPKMKDAIRAEADRLWRETYPDPMLDGEMADRVQARVHNDAQAEVMAREIAALESKVPGDRRRTPLEVMRAAAARITADTVVGKLNPQQHKHAEAKAGREAFKAAAAQDWPAALRARRQQLFSGLMYKATLDARERADEIRGHMAKLAKKPAQERFARAGWEAYLDKVNQILRAFDFRRMTAKELERRKSLRAWVEAQQEEGEVTAIPEALLERVEAERVQNWKEVKFADLEAAFDAVRNIEHLARLKNKLLSAADKRDRDEAVEEMVARAEEALPDVLPQGSSRFDLTMGERASAKLRALANTFDRPENVIEALDGGESGPWHDYFWGALAKAEDKIVGLRREIGGKLKALRKADSEVLAGTQELVTFKGAKVSRGTIMAAVLNTGNAGNLQRLMDGGMVVDKGAGRVVQLTEADVAAMRSMLTAAELRYVQGMWGTVNGLWPEVVALTRRMSGLPPEKVEAQSFEVRSADGAVVRMEGGYWPAVYDFRRSAVGDRQVSDDALRTMMGQGYSKAATPKGHTKERAEQVRAPLLLDFPAVMSRHLEQVMTDIAYREAVKDTMSLLQDQRVRATIVNRLGDEVYTNLRGTVAYTVSSSNTVAGQTAGEMQKLGDAFMTNLTIGALAIRPDIALGNYTSAMIQGLDRTGLRGLVRGLASLYMPGQRARMDARIRELSPFMAQRLDESDFFYQQEMSRAAGRMTFGAAYRRVMMTLHRLADFEVSRAVWFGRYQLEVDRGATAQEAARLADKSIRQTQTAQGRKDASLFERDPGFRQSRQFMGPMFVIFGRMLAAKRGQGAATDIGARTATLMFQVFFAPAVFALAAGRWPTEDGDDDDEEIGVGEWSVWLAANTLMFPLQTLPFLRDVGSAVEASLTGNQINARLAPLAAAVQNTARAISSVGNQLEEYEATGDISYLQMTRDMTTAIAPVTGAPAGQVRISTRALEYLQDNPEAGDVELARLALYGPPRE